MKEIKRASLALLVSPILFIGCMQHEKGSSFIPKKQGDNTTKFDLKDKNQTSPLKSHTSLLKTQNKPLADASIDDLARSVLANMDIEIKGDETVRSQPILIEEEKENVAVNNAKTKELTDKLPKLPEENTLSNLAASVVANLDTKIDGDKKVVTKPLEVGDNWKVITKEDEILETAKEFLGVKYVWAANGPSAFDCSGFTKYVFEKHGIKLPRYSGYQARVGEQIAYNNLRKGDLVFFGTEKRGKVNHVGIYLGNHKFIHASSGGHKVMITSFLNKKFYRDRFLHGQRIVNSGSLASL